MQKITLGSLRSVFLTVWVGVFVLSITTAASAATLRVTPDGAPGSFYSISSAANAAREGDVVLIEPGIYFENVVINNNTTFTITSVDPWDIDIIKRTVINGAGGRVITLNSETGDKSGLTIQGLTIQNGIHQYGAGISTSSPGDYNVDVVRPVIRNNIVQGNRFNAGDATGISIDGVAIRGCDGLIENNLIGRNGISATSADDGFVSGVALGACFGAVARRNVIVWNVIDSEIGYSLGSAARFENNIVAWNSGASYMEPAEPGNNTWYDYLPLINSDEVISVNEIIWKEAAQGWNPVSRFVYSCISNWENGGEGNITSPPLFLDPEAGDFRLAPDSPCIDAGSTDTVYNDAVSPYTQGTARNDMGAYGGPHAGPILFAGENAQFADTDGDGLMDLDELTRIYDATEFWTSMYSADSDADGLLDGEERVVVDPLEVKPFYTTHPMNPDMDGDGILDGVEVKILESDPLSADSPSSTTQGLEDGDGDGLPALVDPDDTSVDADGDGFSDLVERLFGSDPSDGGSLPTFGDANGDGVTNNADAVMLFNYTLENVSMRSMKNRDGLDVKRDGQINNLDAIVLFNWVLSNAPVIPIL